MRVRLNDVINIIKWYRRNIIVPGSVVGKGDRVIQLGGFLLLRYVYHSRKNGLTPAASFVPHTCQWVQ